MDNPIVDTVRIMPEGQIIIPEHIRELLKVSEGDRLALVYEDDHAILMNVNIYAMRVLQMGMRGEFEKAGINSEEVIMELCREVRSEIEGL